MNKYTHFLRFLASCRFQYPSKMSTRSFIPLRVSSRPTARFTAARTCTHLMSSPNGFAAATSRRRQRSSCALKHLRDFLAGCIPVSEAFARDIDATTAGDATPRALEAAILDNYARSPGRRCALRWDDETSGRARSAVNPLAASAYWRMRSGVSAGPLRCASRWPALLKLSNGASARPLRSAGRWPALLKLSTISYC